LVCKLNKVLYGLKQAPKQWFNCLQHTLHQLEFINITGDTSLFIYNKASDVLYLLVYVDVIIITDNSLIHHISRSLNATFSLKQLGQLEYFLGLEIKHFSDQSVVMTQTKYIRDLLQKTHKAKAHTISSPMVSNCNCLNMV